MRRWIVLISAFTGLVGCGTPPATLQPSQEPPTPVSLMATARALPVATELPTRTALPTQTLTPEPLITPYPTRTISNTVSLESSDREWLAESSVWQDGDQITSLFVVHRVDGSVTWEVHRDTQVASVDYSMVFLHHWSGDSRYLYYSSSWMSGGHCGAFLADTAWQRFDVTTGRSVAFPLPAGSAHAISPDDLWMAYVASDHPLAVSVASIDGIRLRVIELPIPTRSEEPQLGGIVWAPDGRALVLSVVSGNNCSAGPVTWSVYRLDIDSGERRLLVSESSDPVMARAWPSDSRILVGNNQGTWWIDANTGEALP